MQGNQSPRGFLDGCAQLLWKLSREPNVPVQCFHCNATFLWKWPGKLGLLSGRPGPTAHAGHINKHRFDGRHVGGRSNLTLLRQRIVLESVTCDVALPLVAETCGRQDDVLRCRRPNRAMGRDERRSHGLAVHQHGKEARLGVEGVCVTGIQHHLNPACMSGASSSATVSISRGNPVGCVESWGCANVV